MYTFPTSLASIIELDCSFNQLEGFRTYSNNFPNLMKFNCERTSISEEIKFEIEIDIERRKSLINKEKKEWLKVLKINSIKGYKEYLVEFPTGKNRKDVVLKLGQKFNKMNKSKKS